MCIVKCMQRKGRMARPNLRAPEGNNKGKRVVSREPCGSDNIAFVGIYLQDP